MWMYHSCDMSSQHKWWSSQFKWLNLSEAAMSTVIANSDTNKQWAMVGVVLYSKSQVQTNEVTDVCTLKLKTL